MQIFFVNVGGQDLYTTGDKDACLDQILKRVRSNSKTC